MSKDIIKIWEPTDGDRKWMPSYLYGENKSDNIVRVLRGRKMPNKSDFMNEIGAALQLFNGFGENWHAVKDCFRNLYEDQKFKKYVIVVTRAELMFIDEPGEWEWFIKTVIETEEYFSQPIRDGDIYDRDAVEFKLVLETNKTQFISKLIEKIN